MGRFMIAPAPGEDGDGLLATERAGGALDLEADERTERGGLPVRRLRYRVRAEVPREVVLGPAGRRHEGGEEVEHLSDVLLVGDGPQTVRAGYAMTTTGDVRQYDAMGAFLDAVQAAKLIPDGPMPEDVDAALRGLHERARWALFSWEREGAMKEYVDGLAPKLAYAVRERLRD